VLGGPALALERISEWNVPCFKHKQLMSMEAIHKFGVEHLLRCSSSLPGESATGQSLATLNRSHYKASLGNHIVFYKSISRDMSRMSDTVLSNERDAQASKHHLMNYYEPCHSSLLSCKPTMGRTSYYMRKGAYVVR
jgi:hypothetical protein